MEIFPHKKVAWMRTRSYNLFVLEKSIFSESMYLFWEQSMKGLWTCNFSVLEKTHFLQDKQILKCQPCRVLLSLSQWGKQRYNYNYVAQRKARLFSPIPSLLFSRKKQTIKRSTVRNDSFALHEEEGQSHAGTCETQIRDRHVDGHSKLFQYPVWPFTNFAYKHK